MPEPSKTPPQHQGIPEEGANPVTHAPQGSPQGVPDGAEQGDAAGRPSSDRQQTETAPTKQGG